MRPNASKNGQISPSVAVRGARIAAVVRAAKRSCQNAAKAQKTNPVWGSSGEFRIRELSSDLVAGERLNLWQTRYPIKVSIILTISKLCFYKWLKYFIYLFGVDFAYSNTGR